MTAHDGARQRRGRALDRLRAASTRTAPCSTSPRTRSRRSCADGAARRPAPGPFQPQYLPDGTYTLRDHGDRPARHPGTDERTIVVAAASPPIALSDTGDVQPGAGRSSPVGDRSSNGERRETSRRALKTSRHSETRWTPPPTAAPGSPTSPRSARRPLAAARRADGPDPREVREFFEQYKAYVDMDDDAYRARIAEVMAEIQATGTYTHTTDELTVGAKLAWYNHTRCIGKLYWRSPDRPRLPRRHRRRGHPRRVLRAPARRPQRRPHQADDHDLRPDAPGKPAARLRNGQIVAYAGLPQRGRHRARRRRRARDHRRSRSRCGWEPEHKTPFDVLPLIVETPTASSAPTRSPTTSIWEIDLEHPTLPGLNDLGLKWYGFPSIANKGMTIGGITYPTSPFTGWYLAPEISAPATSATSTATTCCRRSPRPSGSTPPTAARCGRTAR